MVSELSTSTNETQTLGQAPQPGKKVAYMDTIAAYDQWAQVYDTDGNFLQALDTLEMKTLLPTFLSLVDETPPTSGTRKFVDLGCGTGRNTISIIRATPDAQVIGLEPSSKMLDIARDRIGKHLDDEVHNDNSNGCAKDRVTLELYDILKSSAQPASARGVDGVISTLVLEHVPTKQFFQAVVDMLKPGGVLLLTNMHSEMGGISQAGFTDPETGVKIRPTSYAHTVADIVADASAVGLELVGGFKETKVDEDLAPLLGPRASKWVGIQVWSGGCFRKK